MFVGYKTVLGAATDKKHPGCFCTPYKYLFVSRDIYPPWTLAFVDVDICLWLGSAGYAILIDANPVKDA